MLPFHFSSSATTAHERCVLPCVAAGRFCQKISSGIQPSPNSYTGPLNCWAGFRIRIMGRWHSTTSSGPRNQLHPTRCPNLPSEPRAQSGPSTGLIFAKNNGGTGPEPSHPGGEGGVICSVVYYRERTPPLPPQRSGAVSAQIIKVSVKVLYGWRGETFTEPFLYQAVSKILSENPLSSDRRKEEWLGSVEVPYGIELQTFTDPCCHSTSPAVQQLPMNDVCCRVLQRGDFVRKSQAGYSHLVGGSAWQ